MSPVCASIGKRSGVWEAGQHTVVTNESLACVRAEQDMHARHQHVKVGNLIFSALCMRSRTEMVARVSTTSNHVPDVCARNCDRGCRSACCKEGAALDVRVGPRPGAVRIAGVIGARLVVLRHVYAQAHACGHVRVNLERPTALPGL